MNSLTRIKTKDVFRFARQASALIAEYAKDGIMLSLSALKICKLYYQHRFVFTVVDGQVVACCGLTFCYPNNDYEFGGWAVQKNCMTKVMAKQR